MRVITAACVDHKGRTYIDSRIVPEFKVLETLRDICTSATGLDGVADEPDLEEGIVELLRKIQECKTENDYQQFYSDIYDGSSSIGGISIQTIEGVFGVDKKGLIKLLESE